MKKVLIGVLALIALVVAAALLVIMARIFMDVIIAYLKMKYLYSSQSPLTLIMYLIILNHFPLWPLP